MSRPFARLKLGYYPLPTEEARNIHSVLVASDPYCAIDPCAGDGSALLEITNGTEANLAAIEIDADRAAAAAQKGIPTVHSSAFECKVQSESCSLLYLNPPYDTELGPHSNRRMELVFLDHCYRWLRTDGAQGARWIAGLERYVERFLRTTRRAPHSSLAGGEAC